MILLCVCFFFPTKSNLSLLHGPNIPGSYAMLFFTALDFMFTTRHIHNWASFRFGPATSFCLELLVIALNSYPVAYWTPSDLGGSSSSVISFCLFILFMEFSKQEYWSEFPFPPPVDHVFSELFTMTLPSWVALNGMAHSFIELCKPLCHDKAVVHEGGGFLLLSQHGACYLELESIY